MESLASGEEMRGLLLGSFGFASFRANQEAVCRAVIGGRDALLVMPTGAGKSLCYQLPGVARGGTALVISPLIALMEDQSSKLAALGFAVARLHSGMERADLREACAKYLRGELQFLFIAPERFRVPGFAEMLAKRKPSLIAIDEAHCISQWGHDFRPDYRTLGQHLPALRPAPVLALTATATPIVQRDIVKQLSLVEAELFIHGFRRENLAVEVVEVPKKARTELAARVLRDAARRPAIVYAPTRKDAEAIALELAKEFPTAAYHAGLDPGVRDKVQRGFLSGRLEAVVATIAFGMGIDKADVRTVVHTALPQSLEAYYQEIGRAGRDGNASRTVLMHSFEDRRLHDFFLEQDYPEASALEKIYKWLSADGVHRDMVRYALCVGMGGGKNGIEPGEFDKALEKLQVHGGAVIDYEDNVTGGTLAWREAYPVQADHRRAQLDAVGRFAATPQCRMRALVRHFGDVEDGERLCGCCDVCSPEDCVAQQFRVLTETDRRTLRDVGMALRGNVAKSTGKLHKEIFPHEEMGRDEFEGLLFAAATAGLMAIEDASFEKDGRSIPYRTARLTAEGQRMDRGMVFEFRVKASGRTGKGKKNRRDAPIKRSEVATERSIGASSRAREAAASHSQQAVIEVVRNVGPEADKLENKLKVWRTAEAKELGMPAFCVFGNKTLRAVAEDRPLTIAALMRVKGIGELTAEKFGAAICGICGEG